MKHKDISHRIEMYNPYGFTLLKLMFSIATLALLATALYEYLA